MAPDLWRFLCGATTPVSKKLVVKAKAAAKQEGTNATVRAASTQLTYACLLSQYERDVYESRLAKFQREQPQNTKPPQLDASVSQGLLRGATSTLASLYSSNSQDPELLYQYGVALVLSREPLAVNVLDELTTKFAASPRVGPGNLMMAEYFFTRQEYDKALREYARAAKSREDGIADYVRYKLTWTRYLQGVAAGKTDGGKQVVSEFLEHLKALKNKKDARARLAATIRLDVVDFLVDVGDPDFARSTLKSTGQDQALLKVLERMAIQRVVAEDPKKRDINTAYKILTSILKDTPTSPDAPRIAALRLEVAAQTQQAPTIVANLKYLIDMFVLESAAWVKAQKPDVLIRTSADVERLVFDYATTFDRQGRDQKNMAFLDAAIQSYDLYIAAFGSSPRAPEVRFYAASLAYERKDFKKTVALTTDLLRSDPKFKAVKDAAELMVTAAQYILESDKTTYELPRPGTAKQPVALPESRKNYAATLDLFVSVLPDHPNAADMTYAAGTVFYDYGHYEEALKRYAEYLKKSPKGSFARLAALRTFHYLRFNLKNETRLGDFRLTVESNPLLRSAPELAPFFDSKPQAVATPGETLTPESKPTSAPPKP